MNKKDLLSIVLCFSFIAFDYSFAYLSDQLIIENNKVSIGEMKNINLDFEEEEEVNACHNGENDQEIMGDLDDENKKENDLKEDLKELEEKLNLE